MNALPQVLVVDDASDIQLTARKALEKTFRIVSALTLDDARAQLAGGAIDLVILDVNLPDGNGIDFCRMLSKDPDYAKVPIILLTGEGDISNKVAGFEAGAEDYIVKPFHPLELEARSLTRLRESQLRQSPHANGTTTFGDITFDLKKHEARVVDSGKQTIIPLTQQEFKLLHCIARGLGRILSREEIVKEVWDHDLRVTERTVDTHICKLRKKFSSSPSRFAVQAVYGAGYRLEDSSK